MGLMKSLFGNRGAQQVAENKLVITEVGPNPAQVIAIAQNYFPEDPTGIATVLNDNILEGQSTIITLPETESLYEMQQALDNAGASTYIQKNWQDEEDAPALANIVIYSIGEQKDAVIECYHNILGFDRRDLELKLLTGVSDASSISGLLFPSGCLLWPAGISGFFPECAGSDGYILCLRPRISLPVPVPDSSARFPPRMHRCL